MLNRYKRWLLKRGLGVGRAKLELNTNPFFLQVAFSVRDELLYCFPHNGDGDILEFVHKIMFRLRSDVCVFKLVSLLDVLRGFGGLQYRQKDYQEEEDSLKILKCVYLASNLAAKLLDLHKECLPIALDL